MNFLKKPKAMPELADETGGLLSRDNHLDRAAKCLSPRKTFTFRMMA